MTDDDHDRGLAFDLQTLSRRGALKLFAGAGVLALVGCSSGDDSASTAAGDSTTTTTTTSGSSTTATTASTATTAASSGTTDVDEIPDETGGPYPGDGSNGPNVLDQDGIVRQDIRSSFGSSSGTAEGVPLTIQLTILDAASDTPLAGAAVYLWHCTREGGYSMYSQGVEDENFLRGVQVADDDGVLSFTSVYPACYDGRWPHAHFEIYSSVDEATGGGAPMKTTQLAFPEDVCNVVYATSGYEASVRNLAQTSLETDMVFSDGVDQQLATVTGSVDQGYVASLVVGV